MKFRVSCELEYTLYDPVTFLFVLHCVETSDQLLLSESLVIDPYIPSEEFIVPGGMNRVTRFTTYYSGHLRVSYQAEVSTNTLIAPSNLLSNDSPQTFGADVIPFLLPSRYCQSDRLREQAYEMFGHLMTPHAIASAVCSWIYENIAYEMGSSMETTSAVDTFLHRHGVCRDFAHLAITFCRAMNVPARYVTCYAHKLDPQDFHACFEVFIDGLWYIFDATRLVPMNGLVRIATGRDATDAAVCTLFGTPELTLSSVFCECIDPDFVPITREDLIQRNEAIALL